ncbi:YejA-like protein, partial [Daphnia magna]
LCAHPLVLLELRAGILGPARPGGAGDPGAFPRPGPRRGLHQGVRAAVDRRQRQPARQPARRLRPVEGGRLGDQGPPLGAREDRRGDELRDPAVAAHLGADRAAVRQEPGAPGHPGAGAHGRQRPVPEAHGDLRLRRHRGGVRPVAVARQRAARHVVVGRRQGR